MAASATCGLVQTRQIFLGAWAGRSIGTAGRALKVPRVLRCFIGDVGVKSCHSLAERGHGGSKGVKGRREPGGMGEVGIVPR